MNTNKYSRDILKPSIIGEISQGTIFNGAISEFYEGCDVYGFVISARCDIAQKKVPCYFYLPVVKWVDWIKIEFPDLFLEQLANEKVKSLKKSLLKLALSDSLVGRYPVEKIREILEPYKKNGDKNSAMSCIEALMDVELYKSTQIDIDVLYGKYNGIKKSIFDSIIANQNPNYYFLEASDDEWFILRLREIKSLKKDFFFMLSEGIDKPVDQEILSQNDISQLPEGGIMMPLYQMTSPYVEHVIQMFVSQFNKVGVEDVSIYLRNKINA